MIGARFSGRVPSVSRDPSSEIFRDALSSATKTYAVSDDPPVFVSAEGAWLTDTDGKRYLDFACGSGTTSLGHNHPAIMSAVRAQLESGVTHIGPHFQTAAQGELYRLLRSVLPDQLCRFHPATNGTEATETALKAAMHFTGHRTFLAFEGGYHGRTLGALAISFNRGPNEALAPFTPEAVFVLYGCTEAELVAALEAAPPLAGIIVEPVQATHGMILPPEGFLMMLAEHAKRRQIPLILDEVFTGFGRTGTLFAFERENITPDLLILGKALGGGFPGGLVVGREDIMTTWRAGTQSSTFQLHPVTAAAAKASLETMLEQDLISNVRQIDEWMIAHCTMLTKHNCVAGFRGVGAMFGVEIVDVGGAPDQMRTRSIRAAALERGLITWECGTTGQVIGVVPPITVTTEELAHGIEILSQAMEDAA